MKQCDALTDADQALLLVARQQGRTRLEQNGFKDIQSDFQMELAKASIGDGEVSMGAALLLAKRAHDDPFSTHIMRGHKGELSKRSVLMALADKDEPVWGLSLARWWDRILFSSASLLGMTAWWGTLLFTLGEPNKLALRSRQLLAVHGEWTSRTRHLLAAHETTCEKQPVLVLGRPRLRLTHISKLLRQKLPKSTFDPIRPYSLASGLRALPQTATRLISGFSALQVHPYRPAFGQLCSIAYRICQGAASEFWAKQLQQLPGTVLFGHTGLADTNALERGLQSRSVETVHLAHGLTSGLNFVGISSQAIFRTESDARWHQAFGGYGKCLSLAAPKPKPCRSHGGLLLLTNLAHPMNREYQRSGLSSELAAIAWTVKANELMSHPAEITWKPHPIVANLDQSVREKLFSSAAALGVVPIGNEHPLSPGKFRWCICTPSTVAVDLLTQGVLPIILNITGTSDYPTLNGFPVVVEDSDALANAMRRLDDESTYIELFEKAWAAVRPAVSFNLSAQLIQLAQPTCRQPNAVLGARC